MFSTVWSETLIDSIYCQKQQDHEAMWLYVIQLVQIFYITRLTRYVCCLPGEEKVPRYTMGTSEAGRSSVGTVLLRSIRVDVILTLCTNYLNNAADQIHIIMAMVLPIGSGLFLQDNASNYIAKIILDLSEEHDKDFMVLNCLGWLTKIGGFLYNFVPMFCKKASNPIYIKYFLDLRIIYSIWHNNCK